MPDLRQKLTISIKRPRFYLLMRRIQIGRNRGFAQKRPLSRGLFSFSAAPGSNNLLYEIYLNLVRNDTFFKPLVQQTPDGLATALAVVQRQVVDPHCDKAVGNFRLHIPGKL